MAHLQLYFLEINCNTSCTRLCDCKKFFLIFLVPPLRPNRYIQDIFTHVHLPEIYLMLQLSALLLRWITIQTWVNTNRRNICDYLSNNCWVATGISTKLLLLSFTHLIGVTLITYKVQRYFRQYWLIDNYSIKLIQNNSVIGDRYLLALMIKHNICGYRLDINTI